MEFERVVARFESDILAVESQKRDLEAEITLCEL